MKITERITRLRFGEKNISLIVPDYEQLRHSYIEKEIDALPYWAKLWPSSQALCTYLSENIQLIQNKTVVEIGAGLGVPSIFAALYAKSVTCTDYDARAIAMVQRSCVLNDLQNVSCKVYDWKNAAVFTGADTVLMSDVNYNPSDFPALVALVRRLLENNTAIVLSTPQRLMAKPFIEELMPFCVQKTTIPVKTTNEMVEIFIMQLGLPG